MSNRERVEALNKAMELELNEVSEKYKQLKAPLFECIDLQKLEANGWKKDSYYPAGDQYIFKKGNAEVRVYPKDLTGNLSIMSYWEYHGFSFVDMDHLEEYYLSKEK